MTRTRYLIRSLTLAGLTVGLGAQLPTPQSGNAPGAQGPSRVTPQQPQEPTVDQLLQSRRTTDPDLEGLVPIWRPSPQQQSFQGFPIFPPTLPGYGRYPRYPGTLRDMFAELPIGDTSLLPTVPALPETGWPSWLRSASGEPMPYGPDVGLLVRNTDRVWWKPATEDAFVPLYFYDKLRTIRKGTAIEVRQVGEFELLLHGGSRVVVQGVTDLMIDELSDTLVALQLNELTDLRLEAFGREHRVGLPDGSTVFLRPQARPKADDQPVAPPPAAGLFGMAPVDSQDTFQAALLVFERRHEPGWRGGRATIWNGGDLTAEWQHAFGTTEIAAGERVTFFFEPAVAIAPAALQSEQVDVMVEGTTVRCQSTGSGQVAWSGARFKLPSGAVLRLDPLLGEPFKAR